MSTRSALSFWSVVEQGVLVPRIAFVAPAGLRDLLLSVCKVFIGVTILHIFSLPASAFNFGFEMSCFIWLYLFRALGFVRSP